MKIHQDRTSLSSTSSEPEAWLKRFSSCSTVRFFFSSPDTYSLCNGKVQIAHCRNEQAALKLKNMIQAEIPNATVAIGENRGLCSYYAETGGLLVGYEKS